MKGLNFDEVWENIIKQIEGGEWDSNLSLSENIELKEKKKNLKKTWCFKKENEEWKAV